jgi:hypothetical protein
MRNLTSELEKLKKLTESPFVQASNLVKSGQIPIEVFALAMEVGKHASLQLVDTEPSLASTRMDLALENGGYCKVNSEYWPIGLIELRGQNSGHSDIEACLIEAKEIGTVSLTLKSAANERVIGVLMPGDNIAKMVASWRKELVTEGILPLRSSLPKQTAKELAEQKLKSVTLGEKANAKTLVETPAHLWKPIIPARSPVEPVSQTVPKLTESPVMVPKFTHNALILYDGSVYAAHLEKKAIREVLARSESFAALCDCNTVDVVTPNLRYYYKDELATKETKEDMAELPLQPDGSKQFMVLGNNDELMLHVVRKDATKIYNVNPRKLPVLDRDGNVQDQLDKLKKMQSATVDR